MNLHGDASEIIDEMKGKVIEERRKVKKHKYMSHWVNAKQSQCERQSKYQFAIFCGLSFREAHRIRDFTRCHYFQFLEANCKIERDDEKTN